MVPAGRTNRSRSGASGSAASAASACARLVMESDTAHRPQVRERRTEQRRAQVLRTGRTAGADADADDPLDHLDVPVAPLLDALVDVDEGLADLGAGPVVLGVDGGEDGEDV